MGHIAQLEKCSDLNSKDKLYKQTFTYVMLKFKVNPKNVLKQLLMGKTS